MSGDKTTYGLAIDNAKLACCLAKNLALTAHIHPWRFLLGNFPTLPSLCVRGVSGFFSSINMGSLLVVPSVKSALRLPQA